MDIRLSEVIKKQAIVNIGCTGHVANGKSTLVRALTGIATQRFKSEKERNITINLGYAGCKIWHSKDSDEIKFTGSKYKELDDSEGNKMDLVHHFSFVDCPGHEAFMNNMLTGTAVMDMAFLVEDVSSDKIPQVQTKEHLLALFNSGITDILVLANKCDLVKKVDLENGCDKIIEFLEDYFDKDEISMIPIIAQKSKNVEYIGQFLRDKITGYDKNLNEPLFMNIIRTFDVNKPGIDIDSYCGGVVGGSITKGVVKLGDYIQINPGIISKDSNGWVVKPIITKVESLNCDNEKLDYAIPGGLIAIGTTMDPYFCKSDKCIGQQITHFNKEPLIVESLKVEYNRFNREEKIPINTNSVIKLGISSNLVDAKIVSKSKRLLELKLSIPVYLNDMKVTLISSLDKKCTIMGIGKIKDYKKVKNIIIEHNNIPVPDISYNLINDLEEPKVSIVDFDDMLEEVQNDYSRPKKINMSKPELSINNTKTQFTIKNYNEIISTVSNPMDKYELGTAFIYFLEKRCQASTSFNSKNELIVNMRTKPDVLINNIIKVIIKIKKCQTCSSMDSYLTKEDRSIYINCLTCSSKHCCT